MENKNKILLSLFFVFIISISISIFYKTIDFLSLLGIFLICFIYTIGYIYLIYCKKRNIKQQEEEKKEKKNIKYCWTSINNLLREMPDGSGIDWALGFNKRIKIKYININGISRPFRAIIGHLKKTKQLVIIIYDVEKEDIVEFNATPSRNEISNPFINFNRDDTIDYQNRFNNTRDNNNGLNINLNQNPEYQSMQPSLETVDKAVVNISKGDN